MNCLVSAKSAIGNGDFVNKPRDNRPYRHQISAMHYGSISGMLRNDITLRDSILLHVKDVSLKDIKR